MKQPNEKHRKKEEKNPNLQRTPSIYSGTFLTTLLANNFLLHRGAAVPQEENVLVCSLFPLCVALGPALLFAEGERPARPGPQFAPQNRRGRKKGQLSTAGGGEAVGRQDRSAVEKRTSQGRFQLAQRAVSAASHGGRGEQVGRLP